MASRRDTLKSVVQGNSSIYSEHKALTSYNSNPKMSREPRALEAAAMKAKYVGAKIAEAEEKGERKEKRKGRRKWT